MVKTRSAARTASSRPESSQTTACEARHERSSEPRKTGPRAGATNAVTLGSAALSAGNIVAVKVPSDGQYLFLEQVALMPRKVIASITLPSSLTPGTQWDLFSLALR